MGGEGQAARSLCDPPHPCRVIARPGFQPWPAAIHEVSADELGLVVGVPVAVGTAVAIELPGQGALLSPLLWGEVTRAEPQDGSKWRLTCRLTMPLNEGEVRALV